MNKKKIAIFIDWFTPGYKAGGPITSVRNIIDNLKNDFDFYVITSDRDYLDETPYSNIEFDKWINLKDNVKIFYISKNNTSKKTIQSIINNFDFDIVCISGIYSYFFSILPLLICKKANKKVIVSARGMLSEHAFSRKGFKKKIFLKMANFRNYYKNIQFHATNEIEKKDIISLTANKNVIVIPNLPQVTNKKVLALKEKKSGELRLVSIARISQEKNTKYALEILSKINSGNIIFDIYGSINDKTYWTECENIISSMPENVKVNYKGSLASSKVLDTFGNYHLSFMPSLGENFGHSLFESMLAGTPVLTSDNTPWRDLEIHQTGWDIDLKKDFYFVEIIKKMLSMEQDDYNNFSKKTFAYAKNVLENNSYISQYVKMFNNE